MVFLADVVMCATIWGLGAAITAAALSFLSWNFFFIPPLYQFTIREWRDVVAIILFLGVAAATGVLASRVRAEARAAQTRVESLRRIGSFSRRLGELTGESELLEEIARHAAAIGGRAVVLTERGEDLNIRRRRATDGHDGRGRMGGRALVLCPPGTHRPRVRHIAVHRMAFFAVAHRAWRGRRAGGSPTRRA